MYFNIFKYFHILFIYIYNNLYKLLVEFLSNTCNSDIRRYQDACRELINAEREKCQNEVESIKQQQNDVKFRFQNLIFKLNNYLILKPLLNNIIIYILLLFLYLYTFILKFSLIIIKYIHNILKYKDG